MLSTLEKKLSFPFLFTLFAASPCFSQDSPDALVLWSPNDPFGYWRAIPSPPQTSPAPPCPAHLEEWRVEAFQGQLYRNRGTRQAETLQQKNYVIDAKDRLYSTARAIIQLQREGEEILLLGVNSLRLDAQGIEFLGAAQRLRLQTHRCAFTLSIKEGSLSKQNSDTTLSLDPNSLLWIAKERDRLTLYLLQGKLQLSSSKPMNIQSLRPSSLLARLEDRQWNTERTKLDIWPGQQLSLQGENGLKFRIQAAEAKIWSPLIEQSSLGVKAKPQSPATEAYLQARQKFLQTRLELEQKSEQQLRGEFRWEELFLKSGSPKSQPDLAKLMHLHQAENEKDESSPSLLLKRLSLQKLSLDLSLKEKPLEPYPLYLRAIDQMEQRRWRQAEELWSLWAESKDPLWQESFEEWQKALREAKPWHADLEVGLVYNNNILGLAPNQEAPASFAARAAYLQTTRSQFSYLLEKEADFQVKWQADLEADVPIAQVFAPLRHVLVKQAPEFEFNHRFGLTGFSPGLEWIQQGDEGQYLGLTAEFRFKKTWNAYSLQIQAMDRQLLDLTPNTLDFRDPLDQDQNAIYDRSQRQKILSLTLTHSLYEFSLTGQSHRQRHDEPNKNHYVAWSLFVKTHRSFGIFWQWQGDLLWQRMSWEKAAAQTRIETDQRLTFRWSKDFYLFTGLHWQSWQSADRFRQSRGLGIFLGSRWEW